MNAKRGRVEIIDDILQIISGKEGIKPTQIMYKANLSHQMLTDYMGELLSKSFITEKVDKKGRKTYALTDKGFGFLRDYQVIKRFFDSYALND
ncbi:MAG: winged helix-turn-helix domain-containing protein [Candidatus Woesearchaeota archaeon]